MSWLPDRPAHAAVPSLSAAWASVGATLALICSPTHAHSGPEQSLELADLSLEDLANLEISTAARRTQKANDVAAAAFVITQDDIRRVGARSIPEALRLAPGVHVAQIDANRWAISARGFNGRFSNKLLVLMDGRTLYTPSFSGTYWDMQDTLIHDIERIEVIRGPAGTIWGANAVNGIINIITKHSMQTGEFALDGVQAERGESALSARYGAVGAQHAWRTFAKVSEHQGDHLANGLPSYDDGEQARAGARADLLLSQGHVVTLSSEAYRGWSGQTMSGYLMSPLQFNTATAGRADREEFDGAWLNAQWIHAHSDDSRLEIQSYLDHFSRKSGVYEERRDTADMHVQYGFMASRAHRLTLGADARYSRDRIVPKLEAQLEPTEAGMWLLSAYVQDEISLGRVHAALGVRIEDSQYGGAAALPSLRASFELSQHAMLWSSLSRGERRPSRVEQDFRLVDKLWPSFTPANPSHLPLTMNLLGSERFQSEVLDAYEIGWRWNTGALSFDLAAFYNDYSDMRGSEGVALYCQPSGAPVRDDPQCLLTATGLSGYTELANAADADVYGAELLARWTPTRHWRLTASYSLLKKDVRTAPLPAAVSMFVLGQDPEHQWGVRSSVTLGAAWDWDLMWRSMSRLRPHRTPGYDEINTRIAWRPNADWEFAVVGENLLHDRHMEAVSELSDLLPTAIERSVSLQFRWSMRRRT